MSEIESPGDLREARRMRGLALSREGWSQKDIAAALGVSKGAVSQWLSRAKEQGEEALRARYSPGAPPRLSPEQRAALPDLLCAGAEFFEFRGDVWTRGRVAKVIEEQFGVTYSEPHVGRLLAACGWTLQKPIRRARQRDEAAIERWRTERWPELKKGRKRKDRPSSS